MRPICLLFYLSLASALGGCQLLGTGTPPALSAQAAAAQADVLKPGDGLRITVAGEEELSGPVAVGGDGTVRLELLGAVPAAGLSPPAFQDKVRQLLAAGYLKNPQVVVERMAEFVPAPPGPPALRQSEVSQ